MFFFIWPSGKLCLQALGSSLFKLIYCVVEFVARTVQTDLFSKIGTLKMPVHTTNTHYRIFKYNKIPTSLPFQQ